MKIIFTLLIAIFKESSMAIGRTINNHMRVLLMVLIEFVLVMFGLLRLKIFQVCLFYSTNFKYKSKIKKQYFLFF